MNSSSAARNIVTTPPWWANFPTVRRLFSRRHQRISPDLAAAVVSSETSSTAAEAALHQAHSGLYPPESRIISTEEGFNRSIIFKNSKKSTIGNLCFNSDSISVQLVMDPKGSVFQLNRKIYKGDRSHILDELITYLRERHGFEMPATDIERIRGSISTLKEVR